ncbi:MAG: DNA adenine methylase [Alphaproteobacteria bacterium]|jgi:DNA adenine methylase|nr:DNA adenine methylase [Alphaproteobacteria bacterium]
MKANHLVAPIVKWAGGKRQLLPEICKHIPQFSTYYEPFIGGGALLFKLQPKKAVINDFNDSLMNVYKIIKTHPEELIESLKHHNNTSEYYYEIRGIDRDHNQYNNFSDIEKASRLIYLNKTCYNGLFRVNRNGEFNSPFGYYKSPNIVNEITIKAVSRYLNENDIVFKTGDFDDALKGIRKGAFVYFDPPYDPISLSSNFTGYTDTGFGRSEQERLKLTCDNLHKAGIKFLLSNSATNFIKELYKDYNIKTILAKRQISSNATTRGDIEEVLISNYD